MGNLNLLLLSYLNFGTIIDLIRQDGALSQTMKVTRKPSKDFFTNGLKLSRKYLGEKSVFFVKFEKLLKADAPLPKKLPSKEIIITTDEEKQGQGSLVFKASEDEQEESEQNIKKSDFFGFLFGFWTIFPFFFVYLRLNSL